MAVLFWCNSYYYQRSVNLLMWSLSIGSCIYQLYHQYQHLVCRPVFSFPLFLFMWIKNTDKKETKTMELVRKNKAIKATAPFKWKCSLTAVLPQQRSRMPPMPPTDHRKSCQTGPKGPMPAQRKCTGDVKILYFCFL